ncbi:glycoside hydrolase family 13 protein [Planosporangium thailandense]|uniref:Glycoside hydrolase family 13 protein n=1 Tax=Planosporangium thailandense TaxID=765197 RepID=A0ABX0Y791_9ACTN|nr:glycoside hydrolase family 13 protein [Planosporangium thailandense]
MSTEQSTPWWRDAVIYQIYPRSFADSDGDGIGDLPGITARLDHLADLGVDAVWLSPFYPSPQADAGYDVADYRDVDPLFGRLADFDALVARAHELGIRVIVDLVPNHTSDEHPWFRAALAAGPGSPERDRYCFRDEPNEWPSIFGGSAWTQVPDGQWYLHLFDVRQPDLNWNNPEVRAEFEDVLRFWLDRGVDGFRVDVAHGLIKTWEPSHHVTPPPPAVPDGPEPMWDQDGVHEIYRSWRRVVDAYPDDRILVAEAWVDPIERMARYVRPDEMHQAFNFAYLLAPWSAAELRKVVDASLAACRVVGAPTTWVLSNHDVVRHPSRFGYADGHIPRNGIGPRDPQPDEELGLRRGRAATLLMLGLPGAAYLYQGEELGLPEHSTLPDEARQDPTWVRSGHTAVGRDGCRVPIPWSPGGPSYGFGPGERSWLPQPPSWERYARDVQRGVKTSTFELYREALRLRRVYRLGAGDLAWWPEAGPEVVAFRNGELLVVANLGATVATLPAGARVVLASGELDADGRVPTDTTVWATL